MKKNVNSHFHSFIFVCHNWNAIHVACENQAAFHLYIHGYSKKRSKFDTSFFIIITYGIIWLLPVCRVAFWFRFNFEILGLISRLNWNMNQELYWLLNIYIYFNAKIMLFNLSIALTSSLLRDLHHNSLTSVSVLCCHEGNYYITIYHYRYHYYQYICEKTPTHALYLPSINYDTYTLFCLTINFFHIHSKCLFNKINNNTIIIISVFNEYYLQNSTKYIILFSFFLSVMQSHKFTF